MFQSPPMHPIPHLGLKPQAIRENPLKRVQELISLTCFSRFQPVDWGFNPRWMNAQSRNRSPGSEMDEV
jgi:hypothetical protein